MSWLESWTSIVVIVAVPVCLCWCVCIYFELRTCRELQAEAERENRRKKLNGMTSSNDPTPIELIGSLPHNERPVGVDWTISNWSGVRGRYMPGEKGYSSAPPDQRATRAELEQLNKNDIENPTVPEVLGSMI